MRARGEKCSTVKCNVCEAVVSRGSVDGRILCIAPAGMKPEDEIMGLVAWLLLMS